MAIASVSQGPLSSFVGQSSCRVVSVDSGGGGVQKVVECCQVATSVWFVQPSNLYFSLPRRRLK